MPHIGRGFSSWFGFWSSGKVNKVNKSVNMRHSTLTLLSMASASVLGGSLKDIKHIILFMQENRSFDHVGSFPSPEGSQTSALTDGRSILARWLVFATLAIPTSTSTTVCQSGDSEKS